MKKLFILLVLSSIFICSTPEVCVSTSTILQNGNVKQVELVMYKLQFYVDYYVDYYGIDGIKDKLTDVDITKGRIYDLTLGIIKHESGFYPNSINYESNLKVNSWGLTRILAKTAKDMGWKGSNQRELLDIDTNLKYGVKYLCWQISRYHSLKQAVAAYNAGHVKYSKSQDKYINQWYVDRVYRQYYPYFRKKSNSTL